MTIQSSLQLDETPKMYGYNIFAITTKSLRSEQKGLQNHGESYSNEHFNIHVDFEKSQTDSFLLLGLK